MISSAAREAALVDRAVPLLRGGGEGFLVEHRPLLGLAARAARRRGRVDRLSTLLGQRHRAIDVHRSRLELHLAVAARGALVHADAERAVGVVREGVADDVGVVLGDRRSRREEEAVADLSLPDVARLHAVHEEATWLLLEGDALPVLPQILGFRGRDSVPARTASHGPRLRLERRGATRTRTASAPRGASSRRSTRMCGVSCIKRARDRMQERLENAGRRRDGVSRTGMGACDPEDVLHSTWAAFDPCSNGRPGSRRAPRGGCRRCWRLR